MELICNQGMLCAKIDLNWAIYTWKYLRTPQVPLVFKKGYYVTICNTMTNRVLHGAKICQVVSMHPHNMNNVKTKLIILNIHRRH